MDLIEMRSVLSSFGVIYNEIEGGHYTVKFRGESLYVDLDGLINIAKILRNVKESL